MKLAYVFTLVIVGGLVAAVVFGFGDGGSGGAFEELRFGDVVFFCMINPDETVIETQAQYDAYLQRSLEREGILFVSDSGLQPCSAYSFPVIDFDMFTLIGMTVGIDGACDVFYEKKFLRWEEDYRYEVYAEYDGSCDRVESKPLWILVDRIESGSFVLFDVELEDLTA